MYPLDFVKMSVYGFIDPHFLYFSKVVDTMEPSPRHSFFFPFQEHGEFFHNIYQCYSPCLLARSTGFFSLACKRCRPNGAGRKRYVRRIIIYCDGALLLLCAHLIFSSTLFFLFFQSFPFIRPPSFGREGGGGMRASAVPLYM